MVQEQGIRGRVLYFGPPAGSREFKPTAMPTWLRRSFCAILAVLTSLQEAYTYVYAKKTKEGASAYRQDLHE